MKKKLNVFQTVVRRSFMEAFQTCQWIEHMNEENGKHIHHALCGHGGERVIRDSNGNEICNLDGYEPITKTNYQYHGWKWHSCTCLPNRTNADNNRYVTTKRMQKLQYSICMGMQKITQEKGAF